MDTLSERRVTELRLIHNGFTALEDMPKTAMVGGIRKLILLNV
jgi:hypothetical protein